ncbi:MAG: adenylyltransferase/cytidyltransferase family protein [Acidobacteria bacterium]|nr:adenylyltransferase/cytidyltransferase family protein [Acidobacteriota bacterium]
MRRSPAPILDTDELERELKVRRQEGRTVALANGCFDILHVGHLRYLEGASREADILVVAVNGDRSVREIKGSGRPVMPAEERAEMIASTLWPDYVVIFDDSSPAGLIERLRPDVQCKGTDYTESSVPEGALVRSYGGRVAIVGDPKDHSTTEILGRTGR